MASRTVSRILDDAERAARDRQPRRAMDLLVLALDVTPGDSDVLLRAQTIRGSLGEIPVEAAPAAPADLPAVPALTPAPSEIPSAFAHLLDVGTAFDEEVPALAALSEPDEPPPARTVEEAQALQPEDAPEVTTLEWEDFEIPPHQERGRSGSRARRRAMLGLWALLLVGLGAAAVAWARPGLVQSAYQQVFDPLVRSQAALWSGDWERAREHASRAISAGHGAAGYLALARANLAGGDTIRARSALVMTVRSAATREWSLCLEVARHLESLGAEEAGEAYLCAFRLGAPKATWDDIEAALRRHGKTAEAAHIRELVEPREEGPSAN